MNQVQMAPLTPVVKKLAIAMIAVWIVVQIVLDKMFQVNLSTWFILHPDLVIAKFWLWQLGTYIFFHSTSSPFHLFFNLIMLWFVGSDLEKHWGAKFFTTYFFVTGIGAAILYCLCVGIYSAITGAQAPLITPVMGASGALFGLLVAYGIIFSERIIYVFGILPLKAKYFALITSALSLASLLTTGVAGGEVAHLAHLGGAIVGYVFLLLSARWKLQQTKSKLKKKTSNLRLVVDNDKIGQKDDGPKYWN